MKTLSSERLRALLDAVMLVGSDLNLDATLERITATAMQITDAAYGALGVQAPGGGLERFVHLGISDDVAAKIGHLPEGRGLLGELLARPQVLRLDNFSDHASSVGFPENHPPMTSFLGASITLRGEVFGSIYLSKKAPGTQFTDEDEAILKALATAASIAIDNSSLYTRVRRISSWLTSQSSFTRDILSGESLVSAVTRAAEEIHRFCDAEVTFISFDSDYCAIIGDTDALADLLPLDLARSLPGHTVTASVGTGQNDLLVVSRAGGHSSFSEHDKRQIFSYANLIALARDFTLGQDHLRKLEVLADRDRIGRDLHDHVIQSIFATGLTLQSLLGRVEDDQAELLRRSIDQLDNTIRDIRSTIFELHSDPADTETSLRRRILNIANEIGAPSSARVFVQFTGAVDTMVPDTYSSDIEAVIREAITNAVKHANATEINVTVSVTDHVLVTITDDGTGFDTSAYSAGNGLVNLTHRAHKYRGSCEVTSTDRGTVVAWSIPIDTGLPHKSLTL